MSALRLRLNANVEAIRLAGSPGSPAPKEPAERERPESHRPKRSRLGNLPPRSDKKAAEEPKAVESAVSSFKNNPFLVADKKKKLPQSPRAKAAEAKHVARQVSNAAPAALTTRQREQLQRYREHYKATVSSAESAEKQQPAELTEAQKHQLQTLQQQHETEGTAEAVDAAADTVAKAAAVAEESSAGVAAAAASANAAEETTDTPMGDSLAELKPTASAEASESLEDRRARVELAVAAARAEAEAREQAAAEEAAQAQADAEDPHLARDLAAAALHFADADLAATAYRLLAQIDFDSELKHAKEAEEASETLAEVVRRERRLR